MNYSLYENFAAAFAADSLTSLVESQQNHLLIEYQRIKNCEKCNILFLSQPCNIRSTP